MMPRKNKFLFLLVIVILFVAVLIGKEYFVESRVLAESEEGDMIRIHPGENLQEKMDAAKDGGMIVISSGKYIIDKPLVIEGRKDITIVSDKDVWILGSRVDFQIFKLINSDNITLKNIRACHRIDPETGNTMIENKREGSVIDIENCNQVTLENCELEGCGVYGVYAVNTDKLHILGCYIHHNSWSALGLYNKRDVSNVIIKGCTIINNADFMEKE
ncbi:MAG: right-handed parallel beta-helix repeat-containing protein, partial [Peptostreptococcales bacterium]